MPYETTCPKGHRLQVSDSHLGQKIQCPACNESFVVPDGSRMPVPSPGRSRWKVSADRASDLARMARWTGRPMVAVGLLLVMLTKGCDAINMHNVPRAAVVAQTAVEQFEDDLQFKKQAIQNEIKGITGRDDGRTDDLKADDKIKVDDLRKELANFDTQAAKDRGGTESGEWHDLKVAARNAKRTFTINSYWHELFFVFAAIVLLFGLLIVSWGTEGPERWVSLIMLAIITYSLFVSGLAWLPVPG